MKKIVSQDQNSWVLQANQWLDSKVNEHKAKSLYLPAGESPRLIYQNWRQNQPDCLNKLNLIQIDDVMSGAKKDIFKQFFYDELPKLAASIEYIDQASTQADLGILGIGLNGHVAFHEPGLPTTFYSGCVRLQDITLHNLNLEKGTWGKTYGAGAFWGCKALLLIVKGDKKKDILQKSLIEKNSQIPASALMNHPDMTVLSDFEF